MRRKVTEEKWVEALTWRRQGVRNLEIAERLGVSPGRVSQKLAHIEEKQDDAPSQSPEQ